MAAYRRVYDSRQLQADCKEPGSVPEPYARQSSMGYLYLLWEWDFQWAWESHGNGKVGMNVDGNEPYFCGQKVPQVFTVVDLDYAVDQSCSLYICIDCRNIFV